MNTRLKRNNYGAICVYVDGSCLGNGRVGAVAGKMLVGITLSKLTYCRYLGIGVFWAQGHQDNLSLPLHGRATNQRAEVQAAIEAVKTALDRGYRKICICTDSDYLFKGATEYTHKWRANGWLNAKGRPVANQDDWKEFLRVVRSSTSVTMEHVNAHSGIYGNEMADKLAVEGALMARDGYY